MKKFKWLLVVVMLPTGFLMGTAVQAGSPSPGSQADPLVSKAYVRYAVDNKIIDLQQQVQAAQQRINELNDNIAALEEMVSSGSAVIEEK
ncbi:hypothetical protein MFMK1_000681 [Metallumcola ferriviriculae]|uniref:Uncharacterized protein n=1 Tax=Metallumcola ferriviriculae TaxID=3039180 RepID=A0AAU0UIL5_9FIRM|nr:hypothetical protein MFMK1_000681 [Desulfitibacteraceae bacterium MK1]